MRDILAQPRGAMALRLTAIFLVLTSRIFFPWHAVTVVGAALGLLMLLSPNLLRNRWAWTAAFAALAWALCARWPITENNRYLDAYWLLACALALSFPEAEAEKHLERNARLLIGLTFTLAAAQKALRGEYWDGSFFHGLVLWDERFRSVAMLAGGLDAKAVLANLQLKSAAVLMPSAVESVRLFTSERLRLWTFGLGWLVLLLEASVGLSFLLPGPRWLTERRHYLLFLFVLPTYLLAQVSQFGLILAVMGYAQCPVEKRSLRLAYLLTFAFLCFADLTGPLLVGSAMRRLT